MVWLVYIYVSAGIGVSITDPLLSDLRQKPRQVNEALSRQTQTLLVNNRCRLAAYSLPRDILKVQVLSIRIFWKRTYFG